MTRKTNSEPLVKAQQARGEATREKVLAALQTMEREIDKHGLYPNNDGKVTLTEVARRAGVSAITLRNKHHHQTRGIVQDWLTKLKRSAPTTKLKAQKATREKITWYEDALKKVNFEALKWRVELQALTQENEKLRNQVTTLQTPADAKVVGINSRKTTNDKN
jgi:hypothetical protein